MSDRQTMKPKPDKDLAEAILRLKVDEDFQKFVKFLIRERSVMLAFMASNPVLEPRIVSFMHGRVHELVDLRNLIDEIESVVEQFRQSPKGVV